MPAPFRELIACLFPSFLEMYLLKCEQHKNTDGLPFIDFLGSQQKGKFSFASLEASLLEVAAALGAKLELDDREEEGDGEMVKKAAGGGEEVVLTTGEGGIGCSEEEANPNTAALSTSSSAAVGSSDI